MHRIHAGHCVVCGKGVSPRTLNNRVHPDEDVMCWKCNASPPVEQQCGAITGSGKPCKKVKKRVYGERCKLHRVK